MPSETLEQTHVMEVMATELPSSFEDDRREGYEAFRDPTERADYLTTLVGETMIRGAGGKKVSLLEALEEHATTSDQERVEASRAKVDEVVNRVLHTPGKGEEGASIYRLTMDGSGQVTDVHRKAVLTEDSAATASTMRMAAQVPSGPKQNDSSFRRRV